MSLKAISKIGILGRQFLVVSNQGFKPQVATIIGKSLRSRDYQRHTPFDYKKYQYGSLWALIDRTTKRFDENTKVIVVDGLPAIGKTKFAQEIAEELDMYYVKPADMDHIYIDEAGFDLRTLKDKLPDSVKPFDIKDFLQDPMHPNATSMQLFMYRIRLEQYVDALAHVLSTGQGVVMDRSVYSDFVFAETMHKFGMMSKQVLKTYYRLQEFTLCELMRPHLVLYLDVPVSTVIKNIKERNLPHEKDAQFCKPEVLSYMDKVYKQQFLKKISTHAEVLLYDWTEPGETEVVVEDIERIDFDSYDKHDPKMHDWRKDDEDDWCEARSSYTGYKHYIMAYLNISALDTPELYVSGDDVATLNNVLDDHPATQYDYGFNPNIGDKNLLFKRANPKPYHTKF